MRPISECIITERGAEIYREEEGKSISFRHAEYEIVCDVIPIERCVLTHAEDGRRCDYLFLFDKEKQQYNYLKNNPSPAYYVELKGIELIKACEQILNSIEKTIDQLPAFSINALVVSSRGFIPRYDNNEFYRNVKRITKKDIQFEITPFTITL